MKNESAWAKAILKCVEGELEPVPKGWLTINQIAQVIGLQGSTTGKQLRRLIEHKKAETCFFKIRSGKVIRKVCHYRLK